MTNKPLYRGKTERTEVGPLCATRDVEGKADSHRRSRSTKRRTRADDDRHLVRTDEQGRTKCVDRDISPEHQDFGVVTNRDHDDDLPQGFPDECRRAGRSEVDDRAEASRGRVPDELHQNHRENERRCLRVYAEIQCRRRGSLQNQLIVEAEQRWCHDIE